MPNTLLRNKPVANSYALGISTIDHDGVAVLTVVGDLDQLGLDHFGQALAVALYDTVRILIVDLTDTTFLNTGAMACLVDANRRAALAGGRLIIAAHGPSTARPLHIAGLAESITVVDSLEAANSETHRTSARRVALTTVDSWARR